MTSPAPGWTVTIFETRSGWIVEHDLPVLQAPSFLRRVNTNGTAVEATVLVQDNATADTPQLAASALIAHTEEWRYSMAVSYGGYFVAFGPIMDSDFTDSSGQLRIGCGDPWSLLNRRLLINPATPPVSTTATSLLPMDTTRDVVYSGLAKADVAARLVSGSCSRTGFDLPIDYPATIGGTDSRSYPVYDLAMVGERLMDLSQEDGGPDIDWQLGLDPAHDGYVRVQMRVGNPLLGQSGAAPVFHYGSSLVSIDVSRDGSNMSFGDYVKGNATERSSQVAYTSSTTLTAAGWPALESVDTSHASETDPATIQGYANANISLSKTVTVVWSCVVRVDQTPALSDYQPGTTVVLNVQGHRLIPNGQYTQRVLGVQDNDNDAGTVKLILQALQITP